jgi:dTDP-glucose 4,6-dehydratase
MDWKSKKALITGAGGFIGSHLTEALVARGAQVRAMVHYNALGARGWLDQSPVRDEIEVVAGDVGDRDSVLNVVKGCTHVFHLAALIGIPYSYRAPVAYARTNIEGTLNVLEAARTLNIERLVHTSTSEVYGTAQYVPIDEQHPLQGQSPYSASKIGAEKFVEAYYRSFDVPAVILRPFNTFGPRQSTRAVIPTIITQCQADDTVRLGSLHPTRDMNYVANTVEGFICAAEVEGVEGEVFNIGSGREISIGDLALLIAKLVGKTVHIESKTERMRPEKSEVERLVADNNSAKEHLGWEPRVSLEDGLALSVEWLHENRDLYYPDVYAV